MDKVILVAGILCCVISLAACQNAPEANNSSDLSEGLCSNQHCYINQLFRNTLPKEMHTQTNKQFSAASLWSEINHWDDLK